MARVPYCSPEEFDGDRDLLTSSMPTDGLPEEYEHIYSTDVRHVHQALATNPSILTAFRAYNGEIWTECGLTDRQRESVILTIAHETGAAYEWHQHVRHGLSAGLSEDEIRGIAADDAAQFSEQEAALVGYVRAFARQTVDDATHDVLEEWFSQGAIVGIGALAGAYIGLAHILAAFDIRPEEDFVGWELEAL